MARTVLPIAGAVVGFYLGGAAGAQWGYAAGSLIAGAIPQQAQGPRIGETGAQTSAEGVARAIVYGTCQVTGNVIASGPLIKRDVEENQGGKGGTDVSNEHAYRSYAVRICEGPVGGFLRFWEDDKLVYDIRPGSAMLAESAKWAENKVFYLGGEDQLPDPTLQMIFGVDETPAHRGSAYFVVIEGDLTDRRGSIPQYRTEVASVASFSPAPDELAPLEAQLVWRGQTFSATFTAYADTEEEAIWASGRLQEGSGPLFETLIECFNYDGGSDTAWRCSYTYDGATSPYDTNMVASEIPGKAAPVGYERVIGTAKQVGDVIYSGDTLLQNGIGPVLLPDDPNYDNDAFWAPYIAAALADGSLISSVGAPVTVAEYARKSNPGMGSGQPVPLGDIVTDIHARCDFPAGKFDVSELDDMVSGLVLAGEYTGADAINTLRSLYLFDAADQDRIIVYPKRGKSVVATITEDDIVEAEESSKREQAIEYPKKLHLSYQNAVGGYAVAKATSARSSPDVRVVGEVSTAVPVVLSPDQAAQTAAKMHKIAWAEAEGETKLSVPLSWIKYIASDCFGVALRARVTRERLDELNYADGVIEMTLRRDRQSAYTSNVTGIPIAPPTAPPSTIVGESVLAVIDISPRTETEDDLHYLVAVTGALPAWSGAVVQRSLDFGANYTNAASVGRGILMGTLVNDLADASELYTDTTNKVRVQLYRDSMTIEELTEVQFLSEGGSFVIMRPDGSSEVLQYRDVDEISPGVYDLSHLHRGQLNSGTSAHSAGSIMVGLEDAVHVAAQSSWINAVLWHRAVSYGESPETADEQVGTYTGKSQREWPVAYLSTTFDGTTLTASWTPRHRFGTEDSPVASTNFLGFRVTITNLLQTISFDTTAQNFSVDASAMDLPFSLSVASLNRITGPGDETAEIFGGVLPPSVYRPSGLEVSSTADTAHQVGDTIVMMSRAGASSSIAFYDADTFTQLGVHGVSTSEPVAAVSAGDLTFCVFAMASGDAKILRFDRSAGFLPTHTVDLTEPITDICVGGGFLWAADPFNGWTLKYATTDLTLLTYVPMSSRHLVSDGTTVYAGGVSSGIQRLDIASMTTTSFPLLGSGGVTGLRLAGGKLLVHEGEVNSYNPATGARLTKLADAAAGISAGGNAVVVFTGLAQPGIVFEAVTLTQVASVEDPTRDTTNVIALTDQRVLVAVNPTVGDPEPRAQIWTS